MSLDAILANDLLRDGLGVAVEDRVDVLHDVGGEVEEVALVLLDDDPTGLDLVGELLRHVLVKRVDQDVHSFMISNGSTTWVERSDVEVRRDGDGFAAAVAGARRGGAVQQR